MEIATIMNKPVDAPAVKEFLGHLPGEPKRKKDGNGVRISCKEAGVEISARGGNVSTVFVYPKYSGDLPRGLKFAMAKAQVAKLLGEPDKTNALGEQQWDLGDYRLGVSWSGEAMRNIYLTAM